MPTISNSLKNFKSLFEYNYRFSISCKKNLFNITLTFIDNDFHHLAGLQYLKDIDIPKSPTQLFKKIETGKINDEFLSSSKNYLQVNDSYANVKDRIYGLQFLKEHLESKNCVFKYIKGMNKYSSIEADFLIKSMVNHHEAFIFLRKRSKENTYCLCSFFINPTTDYIGIRSYWLYKSRINIKTKEEHIMIDKLKQDTA